MKDATSPNLMVPSPDYHKNLDDIERAKDNLKNLRYIMSEMFSPITFVRHKLISFTQITTVVNWNQAYKEL